MNPLVSFIQDSGEYAYASARCKAIIGSLKELPRQTKDSFEAGIDAEIRAFEEKLVRIAPTSLKEDLKLFFESRREVEALKVQFRKYHLDHKRREGISVIKLSRWGAQVNDRMSNREVELALDSGWFHRMKATAFRDVIIDMQKLYETWYKHRAEGKRFDYDPLPLVERISNRSPSGWAVILKCYYEKLAQVKLRRRMAWEGF